MKKLGLIFLIAVIFYCCMSMLGCRERVVSPPGIAPTATCTATWAPFGYTYDFEGDLNGWVLGGDPSFSNLLDVPKASVPGGTVPSGNYCAAMAVNFNASSVKGEFVLHPANQDFSAGSLITAHVYLPADLPASYSVQLFILTGSSGFAGHNVTVLVPGSWNTITLTITGTVSLNALNTIAIQVLSNGGADWSSTIYVDDVVVQ